MTYTHTRRPCQKIIRVKVKVNEVTLTFTGEIDLLAECVLDLVSVTGLQSSKCWTHNIAILKYAVTLATVTTLNRIDNTVQTLLVWLHLENCRLRFAQDTAKEKFEAVDKSDSEIWRKPIPGPISLFAVLARLVWRLIAIAVLFVCPSIARVDPVEMI